MSDAPYDPVLDQHIQGGGEAKRHVYRVFRDQSVTFEATDDPEPHHLDFPVQAFHHEQPWANVTTSEPVNVTLSFATAGGLANGAVAHGWIHPQQYLEFWGAAAGIADRDPALPVGDFWHHVQHLLTSAVRGNPPDEVLDAYDVYKTNRRALRTPYIRLSEHGDLQWSPDGLNRAAMLVYEFANDYQGMATEDRLMPVYVAASGDTTSDRDGSPAFKEDNHE